MQIGWTISQRRASLADRQTEAALLRALSEQQVEHSQRLEECLEVAERTPPQNFRDQVPLSGMQKCSRIALIGGATAAVAGFATANLTLANAGLGCLLFGIVVGAMGSENVSRPEYLFRYDARQKVASWRQEAVALEQEARKVEQEAAPLRLLCSVEGAGSATVESGEGYVALGGVRVRSRGASPARTE